MPATFDPYVALSREAGSGGAEVVRRVGERLGWTVPDRQLVKWLSNQLKPVLRSLELRRLVSSPSSAG